MILNTVSHAMSVLIAPLSHSTYLFLLNVGTFSCKKCSPTQSGPPSCGTRATCEHMYLFSLIQPSARPDFNIVLLVTSQCHITPTLWTELDGLPSQACNHTQRALCIQPEPCFGCGSYGLPSQTYNHIQHALCISLESCFGCGSHGLPSTYNAHRAHNLNRNG